MGLVDYSDSEASDFEEKTRAKPESTSSSLKLAFPKIVDHLNPGKIKVSLPQATLQAESKSDEPPPKKLKTAGGVFSGFNSLLPAPKCAGQTTAALGGGHAANRGLGSGANLKTGAEPSFNRKPEPEPEIEYRCEEEPPEIIQAEKSTRLNVSLNRAEPKTDEVKVVGKPLMFRPLSVSRKPTKKKKLLPAPVPAALSVASVPTTPQSKTQNEERTKFPLFSTADENEKFTTPTFNDEYEPLIYDISNSSEYAAAEERVEPSYEDYTPTASSAPPFVPTPPSSQNHHLDEIAGDLHLSASERRRLLGRQKGIYGTATKILHFNTDQEYAHNEALRAAGEQVVHNPVRAIAPGKHSLKQLVSAAQNQKEALEESFAKGKSNRAEANSRYGW